MTLDNLFRNFYAKQGKLNIIDTFIIQMPQLKPPHCVRVNHGPKFFRTTMVATRQNQKPEVLFWHRSGLVDSGSLKKMGSSMQLISKSYSLNMRLHYKSLSCHPETSDLWPWLGLSIPESCLMTLGLNSFLFYTKYAILLF